MNGLLTVYELLCRGCCLHFDFLGQSNHSGCLVSRKLNFRIVSVVQLLLFATARSVVKSVKVPIVEVV